jgi:hypothetical protein
LYKIHAIYSRKIVSIYKTVIEGIPIDPIGGSETKFSLSFPGEETSLGFGLPSHLPMGDVPYPHGALHTVFSTTHLEMLQILTGSLKELWNI